MTSSSRIGPRHGIVPQVSTRLLVVKDAFPARGGGVEALPPVSSDRLPTSPFPVRVVAPDGTERRALATAVVSHIRGPLAPFAMLRLADIEVEAVAGAEVYLDD